MPVVSSFREAESKGQTFSHTCFLKIKAVLDPCVLQAGQGAMQADRQDLCLAQPLPTGLLVDPEEKIWAEGVLRD